MKITYHVHVRVHETKKPGRVQAQLKRKHGMRAILRAVATLPPAVSAPDGTLSSASPTLPPMESAR